MIHPFQPLLLHICRCPSSIYMNRKTITHTRAHRDFSLFIKVIQMDGLVRFTLPNFFFSFIFLLIFLFLKKRVATVSLLPTTLFLLPSLIHVYYGCLFFLLYLCLFSCPFNLFERSKFDNNNNKDGKERW